MIIGNFVLSREDALGERNLITSGNTKKILAYIKKYRFDSTSEGLLLENAINLTQPITVYLQKYKRFVESRTNMALLDSGSKDLVAVFADVFEEGNFNEAEIVEILMRLLWQSVQCEVSKAAFLKICTKVTDETTVAFKERLFLGSTVCINQYLALFPKTDISLKIFEGFLEYGDVENINNYISHNNLPEDFQKYLSYTGRWEYVNQHVLCHEGFAFDTSEEFLKFLKYNAEDNLPVIQKFFKDNELDKVLCNVLFEFGNAELINFYVVECSLDIPCSFFRIFLDLNADNANIVQEITDEIGKNQGLEAVLLEPKYAVFLQHYILLAKLANSENDFRLLLELPLETVRCYVERFRSQIQLSEAQEMQLGKERREIFDFLKSRHPAVIKEYFLPEYCRQRRLD